MLSNIMRIKTVSALYFLAVVISISSFVASICIVIEFQSTSNQTVEPAQNIAEQETRTLATQIEQKLATALPLAQKIQQSMAAISVDGYVDGYKDKVIPLLENSLAASSDLHGVGLAFLPYTYDKNLRLFAPMVSRSDNGFRHQQIEDQIDYTLDEYQWFNQVVEQGASWQVIRGRVEGEQAIVQFGYPIKSDAGNESKLIAILLLDYSLQEIHRLIANRDTGKNSFGILFDPQQLVLWHPNKKHLSLTKNLSQVAQDSDIHLLNVIGDYAKEGRYETVEGESRSGKKQLWSTMELIKGPNWTLAMLFDKKDLTKGNAYLHHLVLWFIFSVVTFFSSLVCIKLANGEQKETARLWLRSFQISFVLTLGVLAIWSFADERVAWKSDARTVITSHASLTDFKNKQIKSALEQRLPMPVFIPTGVFVQSIEFTSANNVILTGYVWQHYENQVPAHISRGFILPEAESTEITPAYQRKDENGMVLGWYFNVTLRQEFEYTTYPFDRQAVWIRLWHKDFDKNVILTPTIEAYDSIHPEHLPGIERYFVLPGWHVTSSFFNYRFNNYNTDFGIPLFVGQKEFPELYYQIGVKRRFLNPFVSNITPIIVVLLMLFAVLITSSKENRKVELLGFNASTIIASCSALFFVVLISHIDLRNTLSANRIFYMEYFYIVTYMALLAISVNSILFSWEMPIRFIQYRDNLMPKIIYWPVITLTMFLITLITFY
jgi:hypothetical protein